MRADPTIIRLGERMFAHLREIIKGGLSLSGALALLALAGCGEDEAAPTGAAATSEATAGADPEDLQVIEDWSSALREGDLETAASYFATPSTAENGPLLIQIRSLEDAVAFNESLPCGAEVISARSEGELTSATFRLSERPGGSCGAGAGGKASTSFEIEDGKIVEWRRIDDAPPGGRAPDSEGAPV